MSLFGLSAGSEHVMGHFVVEGVRMPCAGVRALELALKGAFSLTPGSSPPLHRLPRAGDGGQRRLLWSCPPLQYMGCIEVLRSMRSLDFNTRTQVTRYGPAVPRSHTPMPPRAPSSPGCSPSLGPCRKGGTRGALPHRICPAHGDTAEGHCHGSMGGKRRREVALAGITHHGAALQGLCGTRGCGG